MKKQNRHLNTMVAGKNPRSIYLLYKYISKNPNGFLPVCPLSYVPL